MTSAINRWRPSHPWPSHPPHCARGSLWAHPEQPPPMALTKAGLLTLSHAAFVTRSTSGSSPNSRASSVGGGQRTPSSALRAAPRSAARSAMSSLCCCVAAIIARPIAAAMRPHGGKVRGLIRASLPAHCGWRPIPRRQFRIQETSIDRPLKPCRYRSDEFQGRPADLQRGANRKTNPIVSVGPL